jgi:hypothetical protein
MLDIEKIAEDADLIVNGYAFTRYGNDVRVLNLNNPSKASVITSNGQLLETTMDDIEIKIVSDYFEKNKKYMEE